MLGTALPVKILVDFDKPIKVKYWVHDMDLGELPICEGLAIMSRSHRFDEVHTTANVRVLAEVDREMLNRRWEMDIPENYPIIFGQ